MFGVSGLACPVGFEVIPPGRLREMESHVLRTGPPRVVPEVWFLRRGQCAVAASMAETPPAVLLHPLAPKVTLALHGRPESRGVGEYLRQVDAGVGFVVPCELEALVASVRRSPGILRMRVLSGSLLRPGASASAPGRRAALGPAHLDALSALPEEGLGFLECYESLDRFLAEPFPGVASWLGDEIVAFAVVYARAEPWVEVAVYTREDCRRQGHASAAAASCLQEIVRRGGEPVWTAIDETSRHIGLRLGLMPAGERLYVEFDRPPR
jgi:hypothetical protein